MRGAPLHLISGFGEKIEAVEGVRLPASAYVDAFDQFFFFLARVSCTTVFKTATQLCM
jgi:hypothetical protein